MSEQSAELLPITTGLTTQARKQPAPKTPIAKISRAIQTKTYGAIQSVGRAVDSVISIFAPKVALNRMQARIVSQQLARSYDAANTSRDNFDVDYRRTDADSELRSKRVRLMGISREEQRNDPFFSNGVRTSRNNVIGDDSSEEGVKISAATDDEKLNKQINELWKQYKDKIHLRGRWHFNELASVFANSLIVSGESLGIISDVKPLGSDLPFSIEDLEPDHLPTSNEMWASGAYAPFVPGPDGGSILDGIEYDAQWRIQAYHILPFHPGNEFLFQPLTTRRVPIQRVIHYFEPNRPEQGRGVPFAVSGLNSIYNSNESIKSELAASRAQSQFPIHFKTIPSALPFSTNGYGAPVYDSAGNPVLQIEKSMYTYGESEPIMLKNERVNSQFIPFQKFEGMRGGASMNMSPSSYMKDSTGLNFSSLREDKMEDRRGYRFLQGLHSRYFVQKFWPWFIRALVLTNKISFKSDKIFDFAKFAADPICRCTVSMPEWGYVNPEQEVKADLMAVAGGIKLPSQVIGSHMPYDDFIKEYSRQVKLALGAKLEFAYLDGTIPGAKKATEEAGPDGQTSKKKEAA